jgi:archaellum component FlaC
MSWSVTGGRNLELERPQTRSRRIVSLVVGVWMVSVLMLGLFQTSTLVRALSAPDNPHATVDYDPSGQYPYQYFVSLFATGHLSSGSDYSTCFYVYRGTSSGAESYHVMVNAIWVMVEDVGLILPCMWYSDPQGMLTPGTTYFYKFAEYVEGQGWSELSPMSSEVQVTIPTQPSPGSLQGVADESGALLWWLPASNIGGLPINNYFVYRGDSLGAETFIASVGAVTQYWDPWVVPGETYYYRVTARSAFGESPFSNPAMVCIPAPPALDITADTASMYFPGQMVEFSVLFSYQGTPVDPTTCDAELYGGFRHGGPLMDELRIDTGLYDFSTTIPVGVAGPITLVVTASYETGSGVCQGSAMKCLPTGTDLSAINSVLTSIRGDIADLSSDIGALQFDLTALDTKLVGIDGDIATIGTNVGIIKTNVETINGVVSTINSNVATIQTDLGTFMVDVAAIGAEVTEIKGIVATIQTDLGVVKTDVANIRAQVTEINGRTATIKTDIGDLNIDVHWINATVYAIWRNKACIKTTVGDITVDKDQIDMDYIPSEVRSDNGRGMAEFAGIAILVLASFAAGKLTLPPQSNRARSPRLVRHAGVRKGSTPTRKSPTVRKMT